MENLPLFPRQASEFAPRVDALMGFVFALALFFSLLIAGLIVFFAFKYHHRREADRSRPVFSHLGLEALWTGVPLVLVLGIFVWGAKLFVDMREAPAGAMEIYVVGKQWMWKVQHLEGRREINELHVPVGRPVKLLMSSEDVIHSFFVPAFRVKQDVLPGRSTALWFKASVAGRWHLFCAQYCGTAHSAMTGWVTAMSQVDYQRWLDEGEEGEKPALTMEEAGARLFTRLGCEACHRKGGSGPQLAGLFGRRVGLQNGGAVLADEDYLRESILLPNAKIAQGYRPLMPAYQGRIGEEETQQLVAYLKALKKAS